jgi:putative transposon-encoded protein
MTEITIKAVYEDVLEKDVFQSGNKRMTAVFVPKSWAGRRVLVLLLPEKDEDNDSQSS